MRDIATKATGDSLSADEFNDIPSEIENAITSVGITLSAGDLTQLGKAIAYYAASGNYYTDSGAANAYVLSAIGSKKTPPALHAGMQIAFIAANTNTTTSTVNPFGLGVTGLKMPDGSNTPAGVITAGRLVLARYISPNFYLSGETLLPAVAGTAQASTVAQLGLDKSLFGLGPISITNANTTSKIALSGVSGSGSYNYMITASNDLGLGAVHFLNGSTAVSDGGANTYTIRNTIGSLLLGDITQVQQTRIYGSTVTINGNTAWHAGNLKAGTRGAIASNGGFSVPNAIGAFVALTAEAYDTDAIHDNVTNNTRLTVPAGISKVKVVASVAFAAAAGGDRVIQVYQNGVYTSTILPAAVAFGATAGAFAPLNASSGVLNVAPGDYFELFANQTSGGALNAVCWFAMELIS